MRLVITEKPSVAKSISDVLGATKKRDGYLEGNGYLVSWCVGHLIELAPPECYGMQWRKWTYESLPIIPKEWSYQVKEQTKKQYDIIVKLLNDVKVTEVICATDAGREGEAIFRLVYDMAQCKKPRKRLWISSMEETAIQEGFANLKEGSDYDFLYDSALCRQEADWLIGINATRLFTILYGTKVWKVGRVQTPTLAMLVQRECERMYFKKEKYFIGHLLWNGIDAVTEKIAKKEEAEMMIRACQTGQALITSVTKETKTIAPPKLYDLTTLQREANRIFGFTAKQTLEYTQSLYEKKLCTYPRTDSQFLSEDMEATVEKVREAMVSSLSFIPKVKVPVDNKRILNSKKVTDHHALIPTIKIAELEKMTLPETERNILLLLANRLLCATGEPYVYEMVKAEITCNEYHFYALGKTVVQNGWKHFEEAWKKEMLETKNVAEKVEEEIKLPELEERMVLDKVQVTFSEHSTTPPKHYTEESLLAAMERAGNEDLNREVERKGIGTSATRADIIEKLVQDGFMKREKKQLIPTEEGVKLITVVPDVLKSPKLTADWENALTLVAKGELERTEFMKGIETMVLELIGRYQDVEKKK